MKILAEEIVVRYHVEFDEKETLLLKGIGFLPSYAEPRARLWSTAAEVEATKAALATARWAGVARAKEDQEQKTDDENDPSHVVTDPWDPVPT
jgi:hypothetical protein